MRSRKEMVILELKTPVWMIALLFPLVFAGCGEGGKTADTKVASAVQVVCQQLHEQGMTPGVDEQNSSILVAQEAGVGVVLTANGELVKWSCEAPSILGGNAFDEIWIKGGIYADIPGLGMKEIDFQLLRNLSARQVCRASGCEIAAMIGANVATFGEPKTDNNPATDESGIVTIHATANLVNLEAVAKAESYNPNANSYEISVAVLCLGSSSYAKAFISKRQLKKLVQSECPGPLVVRDQNGEAHSLGVGVATKGDWETAEFFARNFSGFPLPTRYQRMACQFGSLEEESDHIQEDFLFKELAMPLGKARDFRVIDKWISTCPITGRKICVVVGESLL